MAEAPRYQVTIPPGVPVPGVGFVRPDEQFIAPDKFVPSYTLIPLNEPAVVELKKVKAGLEARVVELHKRIESEKNMSDATRLSLSQLATTFEENAKSVRLDILQPEPPAPSKAPGIPLSRLGPGQDGGEGPPGERASTPETTRKGGGRAADR